MPNVKLILVKRVLGRRNIYSNNFISLDTFFVSNKKCIISFKLRGKEGMVGDWERLERQAHITKHYALRGSLLEGA